MSFTWSTTLSYDRSTGVQTNHLMWWQTMWFSFDLYCLIVLFVTLVTIDKGNRGVQCILLLILDSILILIQILYECKDIGDERSYLFLKSLNVFQRHKCVNRSIVHPLINFVVFHQYAQDIRLYIKQIWIIYLCNYIIHSYWFYVYTCTSH